MSAPAVDLVIAGGLVYDGTGGLARQADIAVDGDRIAAIGDLRDTLACARIDAGGAIVTPGFIDVHSHSDLTLLANPGFESTIRQGVTTEVVGNCGLSLFPLGAEGRASVSRQLRRYGYEGPVDWTGLGGLLSRVEELGVGANLVWLVGHSAVRTAAGAIDETVDDSMLRHMRRSIAEALESGAWGLSTGLEYDPGRRASTGEITSLATAVGRAGGIYASHIRNRDSRLIPAVDEAISIARRSGARGQISHLNVRKNTGAAPRAWDVAVDRISEARADGIDVMADATPFTFGLGLMVNLLPPWLTADGPAATAATLRTTEGRERARHDLDRYWRFLSRGEWHRARPLNSQEHPEWNGRTFADIAESTRADAADVFLEIIAADSGDMDGIFMFGDLFDEADLVRMIEHPLFLLGADTMSSRLDGPMSEFTAHNPISFAGHVHFVLRYGLQLKTLPLETLIWKMTGMAAQRFAIADRGCLREGAFADIVVMRPDQLVERLDPPAYATGVDHVLVNGIQVVRDGESTGARPGRTLRPQ